jgi:hypothetical protein
MVVSGSNVTRSRNTTGDTILIVSVVLGGIITNVSPLPKSHSLGQLPGHQSHPVPPFHCMCLLSRIYCR